VRGRAWRRHTDRKKALRKKNINWYWAAYTWNGELTPHWYYNNLHQYSKNKIHCSCGMCMAKTRNKRYKRRHIHGNYAPSINYKHSELKRQLAMTQEELELEI
jgi:hypothetical protein